MSNIFYNVSRMTVLISGFACVVAFAGVGQDEMALWQKAQTENVRLSHTFARHVKTHTDLYDGKGAFKGSFEDVYVFTKFKGDTPVRTLQSHVTSTGKKLDFPDMGVVDVMDHPEKGFLKADRVVLAGREIVTGTECLIFDFEGKDLEGTPFKGKAWIDPKSAHPMKVDYMIDMSGAPAMVKSMKYAVLYDKESMPIKVVTELTVSLLVKQVKVVIQQELSDWAENAKDNSKSPNSNKMAEVQK